MACESQLADYYIKVADRIIAEAELLVAQQNVTIAQMAEWYSLAQYWACMMGAGNRIAADPTLPSQETCIAGIDTCKATLAVQKDQLRKLLDGSNDVNFSGHQLAKLEKIRKGMEGDTK